MYTVIESNCPPDQLDLDAAARRAAAFATCDPNEPWRFQAAYAEALDILTHDGRFDRENTEGTRILITKD